MVGGGRCCYCDVHSCAVTFIFSVQCVFVRRLSSDLFSEHDVVAMASSSFRKVRRQLKKSIQLIWMWVKYTRCCLLLPLFVFCIVYVFVLPQECILKDYIPAHLIPYDVISSVNSVINTTASLPLCSVIPPNHKNHSEPSMDYLDGMDEETDSKYATRLRIARGGRWEPKICRPRFRTAVVVPYRSRERQLKIFLRYMHEFLTRQRVAYVIIIVEQNPEKAFNRGKLFNIGFREASKIGSFDCFIFHDVDLLPEKLANIYGCSSQPRHLITALDVFQYKLPYCNLMGGAVAVTGAQFEALNGFANRFFGWGGEDDDFYIRVVSGGYQVVRWDPSIARYVMLSHKKERPNSERHLLLKFGDKFLKTDGLASLEYNVLKSEDRELYTWVYVDL